MRLTLTLMILAVSFTSLTSVAESVSEQFKGRQVNASFVEIDEYDHSAPIFLILHGTWATQQQELVVAIQELLSDNDIPSLAPTLSLNRNDRKLFLSCDDTVTAGHDDNLDEIGFWIDWLKHKGFENIHVIAHSRGGAQMALFNTLGTHSVQSQTLIAPMVFSYDEQRLAVTMGKKDDDILSNTSFLYCDEGTITVSAYRSYYDSTPAKHSPVILQTSSVKTFIFLGSEDPLTKPFLADFSLHQLPEGSSVDVIDGSDHFFRDLYADEIIEALLEKIE